MRCVTGGNLRSAVRKRDEAAVKCRSIHGAWRFLRDQQLVLPLLPRYPVSSPRSLCLERHCFCLIRARWVWVVYVYHLDCLARGSEVARCAEEPLKPGEPPACISTASSRVVKSLYQLTTGWNTCNEEANHQ